MLATDQIEEFICQLAVMDRPSLIGQFIAFRSRFPVDLTAEFLSKRSDDQIRHIFLALYLQNQRVPEESLVAA